jgi:uncharacterized protein (DUF342 family)
MEACGTVDPIQKQVGELTELVKRIQELEEQLENTRKTLCRLQDVIDSRHNECFASIKADCGKPTPTSSRY